MIPRLLAQFFGQNARVDLECFVDSVDSVDGAGGSGVFSRRGLAWRKGVE
ncbi:hypothetical protein ACNAWD_15485 [Rhodococcus erythropolis]